MSNQVQQEQVDAALAELAELNVRGEVVSLEIMDMFTNIHTTIPDFAISDISKLIKLLVDNPVCSNEGLSESRTWPSSTVDNGESNWGVADRILFLIACISELNFSDLSLGIYLPKNQLTNLYHDLISLLDKVWTPNYEGRVLLARHVSWIANGFMLAYPDPLVVERLVMVVKSRLPTTHAGWCRLEEDDKSAYTYLTVIPEALRRNTIYWHYYLEQQSRQRFNLDKGLPSEWSEELFEPPIVVPYIRPSHIPWFN